MAWDCSTEPEFQRKLDWMRDFVTGRLWPLETLIDELGWEGLERAVKPLQDGVEAQGVWAAHLDRSLAARASAK